MLGTFAMHRRLASLYYFTRIGNRLRVVVLPIPETITIHLSPSERDLLEKYGINVVAAAHYGITKEIKEYIYQEKQFLTKH